VPLFAVRWCFVTRVYSGVCGKHACYPLTPCYLRERDTVPFFVLKTRPLRLSTLKDGVRLESLLRCLGLWLYSGTRYFDWMENVYNMWHVSNGRAVRHSFSSRTARLRKRGAATSGVTPSEYIMPKHIPARQSLPDLPSYLFTATHNVYPAPGHLQDVYGRSTIRKSVHSFELVETLTLVMMLLQQPFRTYHRVVRYCHTVP
jgi:hypothetical protein